MVERLLHHPGNPLLVGANVINQAALAWVHYSQGAIEGYLPELSADKSADKSAIASPNFDNEPFWSGPPEYRVPGEFNSPTPNNRWLPTQPHVPIDHTPIGHIETFAPFGNAWHWWPIGAHQHYSFLGLLRKKEVAKLKFDFWDFNYVRMGIQFFAIRREDILSRYPFPIGDDEHYLSVTATQESERREYTFLAIARAWKI